MRSTPLFLSVPLLALLTACAAPGAEPVRPGSAVGTAASTATPSTATTSTATAPSPTGAARADLVVEVRPSAGARPVRVRLRCEPSGGDHPQPGRACRDLAARPAALAPPPGDQVCTEQYGGPQTARITGTYRGRAVDVRVDRRDGCGIARWEALGAVLAGLR